MFTRAISVGAAAALLLGLAVPASASARRQVSSANLIYNGNAEAGAGSSDGGIVAVPDWTITTGTGFTAVQYGASGGFPTPTDPGPPNQRGANFLAGGPLDEVSAATQQRVIASKFWTAIDAGMAAFTLQGFLGGFSSQDDNAVVRVDWMNGHNVVVGSNTIGPVTAADRANATGLKLRKASCAVPAKTRRVLITLTMTRTSGSYNDGYADNLVLKIMTPTAG